MEFRSQKIESRKFDQNRKKTKSKVKTQKYRSNNNYLSKEKQILTSEEVIDKTLNRIKNLGNQKFLLPSYIEYLNRWQINLRYVLSEFESSYEKSIDDEYLKTCSEILSNIKISLEESRQKIFSRNEAIKSLFNNKIILEKIEEEYLIRMKQIEVAKDNEVKRLSDLLNYLKDELNHITRNKKSIFGIIAKKAMAKKEIEIVHKLESTQNDLELTMKSFKDNQESLHDEYIKRKQSIVNCIQDNQKEIENQEIDGSIEKRRTICQALINAVNALVQRNLKKP